MAVNDTTPTVQYTATASQTTFAYPFEIFDDADLKVYQIVSGGTPDDTDDLLTLTTHYTVTGAGVDTGGNVVLVTGATVGDVITIKRDLAVKRTTDYQNLGDLASESFNTDLDKLIMMIQQNEEAFGRSISLQESTQTATIFDLDDPVANYYAAAKADLSGIKWVRLVSSGNLSVTAFAETLLDDENAAEMRTTIDAQQLDADTTKNDVANTFTKSQYWTKGADVASANDAVLLTDGNYNDMTGTTTVNGLTDGVANETRKLHFDANTPLKHDTAPSAGFSKLWLPNSADYTTAANDEFEFTYDGTYWRVTGYSLASGLPIVVASQTTAANGSSMVLLDTKTASASATIDFTNFIDSTYDKYIIKITNLVCATNASHLYMRLSQASTFITGTDYHWMGDEQYHGGTETILAGTGAGQIQLCNSLYNGEASSALNATVEFTSPDSTTFFKQFRSEITYRSTANYVGATISGHHASALAMDGLRFLMSSGNITSGVFRLYGIKDS